MAFLRLPTKTESKRSIAPAPQAPKPLPKAAPRPAAVPVKPAVRGAPGPTTVAEGPKRRMLGLGTVRVGRQYTVLGATFAVLFVASAVVVFIDNREATYGTIYVSTAAQMRMLSQRIAKAAQPGLIGSPEEAGLRRLGDALAQHAHLRGGRNIDRSVGRLAVVDEHDDRGRDKENRKGRAEDGVLPADADRAQAAHPPLRPFRDGRRSGRTPNRRFDGHRRGPGRGFGQRFWRLRSGRYAPFAFRLGRQSEKCHKSLLELALGSMRARRPHAENRRARRVRRCSARATHD